MTQDQLLENAAKTIENAKLKASNCEKVVGLNRLGIVARLGVEHSEIFNLIAASAILSFTYKTGKSSQEVDAFREGVGAFLDFFVEANVELASIQSEENKSSSPSA